ncbi:perforin-1-like [Bufo bufo]|uniref:perforin-1-like n=1 Tax=Bufo bufo TaxID=8384 RepID=UPI001ABE4C0A|nr:perforin-1-like [Bufo bufo]
MKSKLHLLFWLLLLLHHQRPSMSSPFPRSGCRPGTAEECKDAKFVPGHTLLGEGIDIVTMKSTGSFLLDLQEVGEKCAVCDNPHNKNVLQKLPKALVDWRPETSCYRNIQSLTSTSTVSVANEATSEVENDWKVGLKLNIHMANLNIAVGGSHSQMTKFADSKSSTDNYNFLSQKLECAFYSFGLGSNASFTPHFNKDLKNLPDSYDNNTKAEYRRLIANFGTHYITRVKVGGRTQAVTAVRTCEVSMSGLQMHEVKDCLRVESEIGILKLASINSKVEDCKKKLKKAGYAGDFHQAFSERTWKVIGGNAKFDLLSPDTASADVFEQWMESLKTQPGLVSYSLDSIHNLVKTRGPKRENLRLAISDYINEMAITQKCSCPGRQGKDCSCSCPASRYTSSNCCPTRRQVARVHLSIKDASGLKADVFSQADAYVKFRFHPEEIRTPTIWNKKNPTWNMNYNFGVLELSPIKKYTIEVWDQDVKYDDFLGKCERVLTSGTTTHTCSLKKGTIRYSVTVTCVDHLRGPHCESYSPVPPTV